MRNARYEMRNEMRNARYEMRNEMRNGMRNARYEMRNEMGNEGRTGEHNDGSRDVKAITSGHRGSPDGTLKSARSDSRAAR